MKLGRFGEPQIMGILNRLRGVSQWRRFVGNTA